MPSWRKSSRCNTTSVNCIEVTDSGTAVAVRDSTDPSHHVRASSRSWALFIDAIKADLLNR